MLDGYLNQTVDFSARTGTDDRGQPIYSEVLSIPCRYQSKIQNIVTSTGQMLQAQHVYYTKDAIQEGDKLNGLVVMAVADWVDLFGEKIGYKAVM
ncbi:hypothetical protein GC105_09120 [Alkalibaculum sp. M08DMB]|uniref:Uncharacterized protein n=1 Tax=Alkalibaculum sporogenes TaxID=2655001 RepID=A0A6A7K940_9FIRM|nr:hypothetical protein [Alkalibaculum sporogenes]MPW25950.1 hypothetical protein [Alkalibaculum sporogenes]